MTACGSTSNGDTTAAAEKTGTEDARAGESKRVVQAA